MDIVQSLILYSSALQALPQNYLKRLSYCATAEEIDDTEQNDSAEQ